MHTGRSHSLDRPGHVRLPNCARGAGHGLSQFEDRPQDALKFKFDVLGQDTFGKLPSQRSVRRDLIDFTPALTLGVSALLVPVSELIYVALGQAGFGSVFMQAGAPPPFLIRPTVRKP